MSTLIIDGGVEGCHGNISLSHSLPSLLRCAVVSSSLHELTYSKGEGLIQMQHLTATPTIALENP